jgi:hypothetical protein
MLTGAGRMTLECGAWLLGDAGEITLLTLHSRNGKISKGVRGKPTNMDLTFRLLIMVSRSWLISYLLICTLGFYASRLLYMLPSLVSTCLPRLQMDRAMFASEAVENGSVEARKMREVLTS